MQRLMFRRSVRLATMTAACTWAGFAAAQDMPPAVAAADKAMPPAAAPAPQAADGLEPEKQTAAVPQPSLPQPGPPAPAANPLPKASLEQLVAPIALYPDPLLSQVLMASTYPLEIVEEERWLRQPDHAALKGEALTQALKAQNWDPSVMALAPFPKLLTLMAEKLQWTERLGNAFLAQQADVMKAVQSLRHDAMNAGTLKATPQCHCVIQTSGDTIAILPSDSQVVCVPVYNPRVAYGKWPEPDYPPYDFPIPPDYVFASGVYIDYYPVVELASYGPLWGWWSLEWPDASIAIDPAAFAALGVGAAVAGNVWTHNPVHRGGVAYSDPAVTTRFGATRTAALRAGGRMAFASGAAAGAGHASPAGTAAAAVGRTGGATSAGRFGGPAAAARLGGGGGHVAHANFAARGGGAAHVGGGAHGGGHFAHANFAPAHFGGPHFGGGGPHFGGGGGHIAHANFAPAHIGGGGPHFGGGGGGPHFGGGGGAPHGGGGGGGAHGGGGGGGGGGHGHH